MFMPFMSVAESAETPPLPGLGPKTKTRRTSRPSQEEVEERFGRCYELIQGLETLRPMLLLRARLKKTLAAGGVAKTPVSACATNAQR